MNKRYITVGLDEKAFNVVKLLAERDGIDKTKFVRKLILSNLDDRAKLASLVQDSNVA